MSSEWPFVNVEDACELIVDCVNKTAPIVSDVTPYRMLRTTNIRNGRVNLEGCRFVDEETYAKWTRRAKLQYGDVLLTREAPIGEVGFVDAPEGLFLGQRIMQYRADVRVLHPRFLHYVFQSPNLKHQFGSHEGSGSVVSHVRVGDCFKFKIPLPPLHVQREIAELLGAFDDRINLFRETNVTLERIAQALFKSWFIDFDPVRAKVEGLESEGLSTSMVALFPDSFEGDGLERVPKGWRILPLEEAYEINPKRNLKKGELAPYLDMAGVNTQGHVATGVILREMSAGAKFVNGDTLLARITPCLENGKSAFVDFLSDNQVGWGSTEFIVLRPKVPLPVYHGYLLTRYSAFREYAIQSMSGTSGRQRVQNDVLGRYPVVIPSKAVADAFGVVVSCLQQKISANQEQAKTLAELRDVMLPRLISGELRLPEAQTYIKNAFSEPA